MARPPPRKEPRDPAHLSAADARPLVHGCALAITIAVGLASRRFPLGFALWDKSLGDVLYTVMVYLLVALAGDVRAERGPDARLRRRLRPPLQAAVALGISLAVEAFQLTGIPMRLPRILQIALGTTFAWHDVACYFVGAAAALVGNWLLVRASG